MTGLVLTLQTVFLQHPVQPVQLANARDCALALGFFDGIHLGHRRILETAREAAEAEQLMFAALTFSPHPLEVLRPADKPFQYLTPLEEKKEKMAKLGVETLYVIRFTEEFARLSPEEFVEQYLIGLRCRHAVAGFDFTFGHRGLGNMSTLETSAGGRFRITTVAKVHHNELKISSTAIRNMLAAGEVERIPHFLGEHYEAKGTIGSAWRRSEEAQLLDIRFDPDYRLPAPGYYQVVFSAGEAGMAEGVCRLEGDGSDARICVMLPPWNGTFRLDGMPVKVRWLRSLAARETEIPAPLAQVR